MKSFISFIQCTPASHTSSSEVLLRYTYYRRTQVDLKPVKDLREKFIHRVQDPRLVYTLSFQNQNTYES